MIKKIVNLTNMKYIIKTKRYKMSNTNQLLGLDRIKEINVGQEEMNQCCNGSRLEVWW